MISNSKAIELREKETKLYKDLQAILDGAEGRALGAEECEKVEKLNSLVDDVQGELRDAQAREAADLRLSAPAGGGWQGSGMSFSTSVEEKPESDLRGFLAGKYGDRMDVRALPIDTSDSPGVGEPLYQQFIPIADRLAPARAVANVNRFASADVKYFGQGAQLAWDATTAEGSEFDAMEPTFESPTVTVKNFAAYTSVTTQMVEDTFYDLEGECIRQLSEVIAYGMNKDFTQGTSNSTGGLFVDHSSGGDDTGGTNYTAKNETSLTVEDLVGALTSLAGNGYFGRPGAFVVSAAAIDDLLKESADGRPVLQPQASSTFATESPFQVFGRPVYVTSGGFAMAADTVQACYVADGAFSVADVGTGMSFIRDPYTNATSGVIRLTAAMRSCGVMTQPRGHITITTKAS